MPESKSPQATAPYASWKSFMTFLDRLAEKGLPQQVDRTVMSKMSGATQSNIRVALSFLKLTDSDGAPTDALRRLVGEHGDHEAWKAALRDVVLGAYEPVISDLSLENGTADQLWKCFRENGNVRGSTLSRAVRFYLAALGAAGVKHSSYFKAPTRTRPTKAKQESDGRPGGAEAPRAGKPAEKPSEKESDQSNAKHRQADRMERDWRSHSFHLPNYKNPVEVRAPTAITQEEWELVNLFMTGTIKLATRQPSPPDNAGDEG